MTTAPNDATLAVMRALGFDMTNWPDIHYLLDDAWALAPPGTRWRDFQLGFLRGFLAAKQASTLDEHAGPA